LEAYSPIAAVLGPPQIRIVCWRAFGKKSRLGIS